MLIKRVARGFTLVELLVVMGIIGILVSLLFPAFQTVRQAARQTKCSVNMRQLALATLTYEGSHRHLPRGDDGKGGSYMVAILSQLKQEYLYELSKMDLGDQTYQDRLVEMSELEVETIICPATSTTARKASVVETGDFTTHYYGISGPVGAAHSSDGRRTYSYRSLSTSEGPIGLQGVFSPGPQGHFRRNKTLADIVDGTSYTFAFGEVSATDISDNQDEIPRAGWAFGSEFNRSGSVNKTYAIKSVAFGINKRGGSTNDQPFSSNHTGGAQFALLDGSVRFVSDRVSVDVLKGMCSIAETEKPENLDEY